ncbi:MAG TPA: leucine-rich repeat domain-containing protein [Chthoniobacter sp.]|nr:leucine-rich repeat domain-containing protein [Chthoniobacter sp.]
MFSRKPCDLLEEAVAHPSAIRRLRLNRPGVSFEAFSQLLPQLTHIREIQLGWQTWTELPQSLSDLQELRSLAVLNTPIQSFPAFLASCPHLTELVLRGTGITSIPASVQAFRHLRRLDFSNNLTQEIPHEIGQLSELKELQLADNGLKSLPESVADLRHLRSLALAGNRFSVIEASRVRGWFRSGVVSVSSSDDIAT